MISRGAGRAVAALALVLALSACDDNPLAEDRDKGAYFMLNPSHTTIYAGDSVRVVANVVNKYGAAIDAPVQATPCDGKVSVAVDTTRTQYERPERFFVKGLSFGESCVVVRGGGVTDTLSVRIGPTRTFDGTAALASVGPPTGSITTLVLSEGTAVEFDADTRVQIFMGPDSIRSHLVPGTPANQRQIVIPFGVPAGTIRYELRGLGEHNWSQTGTIELPTATPAADPFEPDNTIAITPKSMVAGQVFYGSISGADTRDFIRLTVPETGQYRVSMAWNDGSDHDFYVRNTANTASLFTGEGNATVNPETGLVNLTEGVTYWLRADAYTYSPQGGRASTYQITVVKQ